MTSPTEFDMHAFCNAVRKALINRGVGAPVAIAWRANADAIHVEGKWPGLTVTPSRAQWALVMAGKHAEAVESIASSVKTWVDRFNGVEAA